MRKKRGLFGAFAVLALSVTVLAVAWRYGKRQDAGNEETVPEKTETEEAQTEKAQTEEAQTEEIKSPDSKETAEQPEPGSEMEPAFADQNPAEEFYITEISDELFSEMQGKSYRDDCMVPREELRYVHILHKDLDGNTKEGELVVNQKIAEDVLEIFKELYEADYPIEKVRLVDAYDADDEASMRDNNTSAFNFRFISHTTKVSKHGEGLAVDINTLYNPYVKEVDGQTVVEPETALPYVDRTLDFPYKIDHGDLCYKLFTEHGFVWGGDWETRKDYQHFEMPDTEE